MMSFSEKEKSEKNSILSRYGRMLDNFEVGFKIVDFEYRYIYLNNAASEYLKINRDEVLGKRIFDLFHDFEQSIIYEILRRCMEDRKERTIDDKIEYIDGTHRWIRHDFKPDPEGVFVTLEDITREKKRDEERVKFERQLWGAMEMALLAYWEYDVKNDLFLFNDQFYSIYKSKVEDAGGYYLSSKEYAEKFVHPEDIGLVAREVGRVVDTDDPDFNVDMEHRIIYGDGNIGHISVKYFIEKDSEGNTVRTYGVNQDISERREAEEALIQSHARLTNLASQVPGMLYQLVKEADGTFSVPYSSQNVEEMFGYRPEDIAKDFNYVLDSVYPDDREKLSQSIKESAENLSQWKFEYRVKPPGKTVKWIYGNARPEKRKDGSIIWSGYNVDITEHKQASEELKLNKERMQAILEASPDPVVVYDESGRVTFISPSFSSLFGWSRDELLGKTIPFIPESEKDITYSTIRNLFRSGGTVSLETKRLTKDGKEVDVLVNAAAISDVNGDSVGLVVNLTDLTQIKKMEEDLRQAQRIESIGRLAGGVAHDFNNFLGVIMGNVEIAIEDVDERSSSILYNLQEIRKAAVYSSNLTRQLLAFARKQTVSPMVLDLNTVIEGMMLILKRLMGKSIELSWLPSENIFSVKMDPSQIDQILANLCVNARDAIDVTGKVTIETSKVTFDEDFLWDNEVFKKGDYVMLAVSDNGCGMDSNTMKYLFEPFFTTKAVGHGTGLGLATVYGIVKQNNCIINVYSEEGQGSSFKLYIPRFKEVSGEKETEPKKRDPEGDETVLLVEDDPSILIMSKLLLERLGYNVLSASNPEDALKIAQNHRKDINLFMTDVVMPKMNGRELAERILVFHPEMRSLFMSGYTENVISGHGILAEDFHFINKPFTKNELAGKIREVLE